MAGRYYTRGLGGVYEATKKFVYLELPSIPWPL